MSTIPAALEALIARYTLIFPGVQVLDGPTIEELQADTIVVGWSVNREGVTVDIEQQGLAGDDREIYEIAHLISCFSGDVDIKPLRDRAFGYYNTITAELKRDQTLGGVVFKARSSLLDYDPVQTEKGAVVDLGFAVTCMAFA